MADNHLELISAFVDGELSPNEVSKLLEMVASNEQVKHDLLRYQHASDTMHGYGTKLGMIDLSSAIADKINTETIITKAPVTEMRKKVISVPAWFWKQAAGFAVAASIGALAVVGVIQNQPSFVPTAHLAQTQSTEQQNPNRWTVGEVEVQQRLNDYLVDHNEYAGASGPFSYARVVTYSEE